MAAALAARMGQPAPCPKRFAARMPLRMWQAWIALACLAAMARWQAEAWAGLKRLAGKPGALPLAAATAQMLAAEERQAALFCQTGMRTVIFSGAEAGVGLQGGSGTAGQAGGPGLQTAFEQPELAAPERWGALWKIGFGLFAPPRMGRMRLAGGSRKRSLAAGAQWPGEWAGPLAGLPAQGRQRALPMEGMFAPPVKARAMALPGQWRQFFGTLFLKKRQLWLPASSQPKAAAGGSGRHCACSGAP